MSKELNELCDAIAAALLAGCWETALELARAGKFDDIPCVFCGAPAGSSRYSRMQRRDERVPLCGTCYIAREEIPPFPSHLGNPWEDV